MISSQAAFAKRFRSKGAVARDAESKAVLSFVEDHIIAAARPRNQEGGLGKDVTLRKAIESALPFVEKSFPNEPLIEGLHIVF